MTLCHIALGGNLGDVPATFAEALRRLDTPESRVVAFSRNYSTPPMGSNAGGSFWNAAATLKTSLAPQTLLEQLLALEDQLGRRRGFHWGPRTIDLDLILFADEIIATPTLRVPHPGCWYRRFVLDPLAEIAPDAVHPETGETILRLQQRLLARPFVVACETEDMRAQLEARFKLLFPDVRWAMTGNANLSLTHTATDCLAQARQVVVPRDHEALLDAAQAVLVAAVLEPQPKQKT